LRTRKKIIKHAKSYKITRTKKKKKKEVDNDKARGTIVRSGKTTESTDDTIKATNNKALKASVATSINSTTQSGPTIHTAAHVGARTDISPTHTQQVMSPIDTAVEKNQSSGKNPGKPSDLFDNDVEPDPTENNQPPQKKSN
jgi:hypothetical protein